jgi:transcription initiation factor TFIIIB Brf1 subunit/transcription initiation factor TFIIB
MSFMDMKKKKRPIKVPPWPYTECPICGGKIELWDDEWDYKKYICEKCDAVIKCNLNTITEEWECYMEKER